MELKATWPCSTHLNEHGGAGFCYVTNTSEHVLLNARWLKAWAAAIVCFSMTSFLALNLFRLHMSQQSLLPPTFLSSMVVVMDIYLDLGLEAVQGQGYPPPFLISNLAMWCKSYRGCFPSLEVCLKSVSALSHHLPYATTLSLPFGRHTCPLPFLPSPRPTLSFDLASVTSLRPKALIWLHVKKLWPPLISPRISSLMYLYNVYVILLMWRKATSSNSMSFTIGGMLVLRRRRKSGATFSVCRSTSLDWKKDRNRTELNCKRPDHQLRLHKFWIFSVASCDVCQKIEKPKKTGLSSRHVLDLTYAHFSLIVSLWIIKNGQELVEI